MASLRNRCPRGLGGLSISIPTADTHDDDYEPEPSSPGTPEAMVSPWQADSAEAMMATPPANPNPDLNLHLAQAAAAAKPAPPAKKPEPPKKAPPAPPKKTEEKPKAAPPAKQA